MSGSLISMVSYGSDDLFLSGAPQITFFKFVYRRYTPFSKENILFPINNVILGKKYDIDIPKYGDLVNNMYLQVIIPEILLNKTDLVDQNTPSNLIDVLNSPYYLAPTIYTDSDGNTVTMDFISDYATVQQYFYVNVQGYITAKNKQNISNVSLMQYMTDIVNSITAKSNEIPNIITQFQNVLKNGIQYNISIGDYADAGILDFSFTDITYILTNLIDGLQAGLTTVIGYDLTTLTKSTVLNIVSTAIQNNQKIYDYYFGQYNETNVKNADAQSQYAKFAWNEKLMNCLINYISIRIGGEEIDKHYCTWIDVWFELTISPEKRDNFNKMIGNVSSLTTYDRNAKPQYILYLPLTFWLCKYAGSSFPIKTLGSGSNLNLTIKFNRLEECGYIEPLPIVDNTGKAVDFTNYALELSDIWQNKNYQLMINLCVDYVYLGELENRRFITTMHEYLIESIETTDIKNQTDNKQNIQLEFTGPSKFIVFLCRKKAYNSNNYDGNNFSNKKSLKFNYSTGVAGINPFYNIKLTYNGMDRFLISSSPISSDGNYFNYVVPYNYFNNTPSNGINVNTFSLFPLQLQPSSTSNYTCIKNPILKFELNNDMFQYNLSDINPNIVKGSTEDTQLSTEVDICIFSMKTNLLRIGNGYGSTAFT